MKLNYFDKNSDIVSKMQKSSHIYIYGAGELAYSVRKYLEQLNIIVTANAIDDEYLASTKSTNTDLISLRDALCNIKKSQNGFLIWAIARPSKLKKALKEDYIAESWITYDVYNMWDDYDYAHIHKKEFAEARELFKDDLSKNTFDAYLEVIDGNPENDVKVIVDGAYFNELTAIYREGCFIDCGAYIGDSALEYVKIYGKQVKIYSFEPDSNNYNRLVENTQGLNIITVNAGCWSEKTTLHFSNCGNAASSIADDASFEIDAVTIDDTVGDDKVAFVKMDVEGSELNALKGMAETIKRDMPILAISAYHKQEDLITLPQYINDFSSETECYDLYLRHHGCTIPELVIYAIPVKREL